MDNSERITLQYFEKVVKDLLILKKQEQKGETDG